MMDNKDGADGVGKGRAGIFSQIFMASKDGKKINNMEEINNALHPNNGGGGQQDGDGFPEPDIDVVADAENAANDGVEAQNANANQMEIDEPQNVAVSGPDGVGD